MNKIEIEIPAGKEVDWETSAQRKQIVLKDKQLTYENICKKLFKDGYCYTDTYGKIHADGHNQVFIIEPNTAKTSHQLECVLAKNKLANVARYLNGNWTPDKTNLGHFDAHILYATPNKDYIGCAKISDCSDNSNVLFKSEELARQAIEILGEEIVFKALEPLY